MGEDDRPGRILVVDDDGANRDLLRLLLERGGYEVLAVATGEAALEATEREAFDVVLLDVCMPGTDGLEVCRRLKACEETASAPVLLITALSDRESRLQGIEAGADDYLTKPIDREDLRLRVRNALRSKRLFDRVRGQLVRLQELESLRDSMTHMIIHDLRSPMITITGFLELLERRAGERLVEKERGYIRKAMNGTDRLVGLINSLLDVGRLESKELPIDLGPENLAGLVGRAVDDLGPPPDGRRIVVEAPDGTVPVTCDAGLVLRILNNLLSNALRFSPPGGTVRVELSSAGDGGLVRVVDEGPGVPVEERERIFDKFAQVRGHDRGNRPSSGLGLTFCKLAVEAQGGGIGVDGAEGGGAVFWFRLPA